MILDLVMFISDYRAYFLSLMAVASVIALARVINELWNDAVKDFKE